MWQHSDERWSTAVCRRNISAAATFATNSTQWTKTFHDNKFSYQKGIMRYATWIWNLVNCCTNNRTWKACNRWLNLKSVQGRRKWRDILLVVYSDNVCILHHSQDSACDCMWRLSSSLLIGRGWNYSLWLTCQHIIVNGTKRYWPTMECYRRWQTTTMTDSINSLAQLHYV